MVWSAQAESRRVASVIPPVHPSLFSFLAKKGAKKLTKDLLESFIKERIKNRLKQIAVKKYAKRYAREADDILSILTDPWWAQAIGFIPVAGDVFDLVHTPKQIKTALQRADGLAAKVDDIIDIQHKPIAVLVDAQTKRSPSWARELADKSYAEIHQLADGGSHKAAQMRKLIDQQPRFQQRNYSR